MVGEELGNYRVIAPLGKGGMASVYVGEHKVLGHKVAIKILHPKHLANESIERRFFNEAKAIASIKHPSVVELFDFGRADDGRAYIVMELLEGESLRARIRSGIMDQAASATFARQVASGLAKAHDRGIIHRDLKPDNVFLVRDPEVSLGERAKVLDFGIAKQTDFGGPVSEHTATGILVGTPAYMSPEQCRGNGTVDARSDIYSLGVVLYRMVTNQLPFEASGTGELIGKHLYVEPKLAKELNPLICDEMDAVIQKCLAKDPADRFQSMVEVADALQAARKAIKKSQATPSPLPSALAKVSARNFATPPSNQALKAPPGSNPPQQVPPEELATEIQTTPSPMEISGPPSGTFKLEEETSPTTLRHATGEASRVDYEIPSNTRRYVAVFVGSLVAAAVIAFAVSGGDDDERGAAASEPAGEASTDPSPAIDETADTPDPVPVADNDPTVAGATGDEGKAAEDAEAAAKAKAQAEAEAAKSAAAAAAAEKERVAKEAKEKARAEREAAAAEKKRLAEEKKAEKARLEALRKEQKAQEDKKRAEQERARKERLARERAEREAAALARKKDRTKGKKEKKRPKKDEKKNKGKPVVEPRF